MFTGRLPSSGAINMGSISGCERLEKRLDFSIKRVFRLPNPVCRIRQPENG
nr:hypothetical protein [uncultured Kingella sp.]